VFGLVISHAGSQVVEPTFAVASIAAAATNCSR
jgi:hypothetical protein